MCVVRLQILCVGLYFRYLTNIDIILNFVQYIHPGALVSPRSWRQLVMADAYPILHEVLYEIQLVRGK